MTKKEELQAIIQKEVEKVVEIRIAEIETEMDILQGEIDALIDEVKKIKVMQKGFNKPADT